MLISYSSKFVLSSSNVRRILLFLNLSIECSDCNTRRNFPFKFLEFSILISFLLHLLSIYELILNI